MFQRVMEEVRLSRTMCFHFLFQNQPNIFPCFVLKGNQPKKNKNKGTPTTTRENQQKHGTTTKNKGKTNKDRETQQNETYSFQRKRRGSPPPLAAGCDAEASPRCRARSRPAASWAARPPKALTSTGWRTLMGAAGKGRGGRSPKPFSSPE